MWTSCQELPRAGNLYFLIRVLLFRVGFGKDVWLLVSCWGLVDGRQQQGAAGEKYLQQPAGMFASEAAAAAALSKSNSNRTSNSNSSNNNNKNNKNNKNNNNNHKPKRKPNPKPQQEDQNAAKASGKGAAGHLKPG